MRSRPEGGLQTCPKCRAPSHDGEDHCLACGVAFAAGLYESDETVKSNPIGLAGKSKSAGKALVSAASKSVAGARAQPGPPSNSMSGATAKLPPVAARKSQPGAASNSATGATAKLPPVAARASATPSRAQVMSGEGAGAAAAATGESPLITNPDPAPYSPGDSRDSTDKSNPTRARPDAEGGDPLIGQTPLGQYRITSKIGEGGFGAVYLAEQLGVERKAVIKVLRAKAEGSEIFIKRFQREAAVLARLDNQHLVRLYNFGSFNDGQLFLAMEYGGKETLADVIKRDGRFAPERALRIGMQICEALDEAHQHGIVHRDLKPQNILLSKKGDKDWAKVVDVGIAKILDVDDIEAATLTRSGALIGTPAYFSPEQARGLPVDPRSDIYSAGVVLYEMLTGVLPVVGVTPMDYVRAHAVDTPSPMRNHRLEVPPWFEAAVSKALEKDPGKRYQSASEMAEAFRAARERLLAMAPTDSRSKRPLFVGAALLLVVLSAVGAALVLSSKPRPPVSVDVALAPQPAANAANPPAPAAQAAAPEPPQKSAPPEAPASPAVAAASGAKTDSNSAPAPAPVRPGKSKHSKADPATETAVAPLAPPVASADPWPARMRQLDALSSSKKFKDLLQQADALMSQGPSDEAKTHLYKLLALAKYNVGDSSEALQYEELYRGRCAPSERAEADAFIKTLHADLGDENKGN